MNRYPMTKDQNAQIDCRQSTCIFNGAGGHCTNISPAITLNKNKYYTCWSKNKYHRRTKMNITKISLEQANVMARIAFDVCREIKDEYKVEHMLELWENQGYLETKFDLDLQQYHRLYKTPSPDLTGDDKIFLFNFIDTLLEERKK